MNEFIESIRSNLDTWGELAEVILNALSLLCIVAGIVISLVRSIQYRQRYSGDHPLHTRFRMLFGGWLFYVRRTSWSSIGFASARGARR